MQNLTSHAYIRQANGTRSKKTKLLSLLILTALVGLLFGAPPQSEAASACSKLKIVPNTAIDGFVSDQFRWSDSTCQPRSAALVRNNIQDPAGKWGGYMRQYTYLVDGATRTVNGSSTRHPGFGYTTNHFGANGGSAFQSHNRQGTSYSTPLKGSYHAIHQFKTQLPLDGPVNATIQWFFATGRDHPIWSITYDSSPAGRDVVRADTRSPYGDIQWDGGAGATVAGVGWGDHYKFKTTSTPLSFGSEWDYSRRNTVPYAMEWATAVDAEMGMVQTQTYQQHDAGGYWAYPLWGKTSNSPDLPAEPLHPDGMPKDYNWTYQLNQYEIPFQNPVTSKRMAWGSNFGAVGQSAYPTYGDAGTRSGYPYQSYSLAIVLGKHSRATVDTQVKEIETVQRTTLTARTGQVATSGPAGIARADRVNYRPVGYNHIYSTWELIAGANNSVDFDMNIAAGTSKNPVFVIRNYTAGVVPATITINGVVKQAGTGFFPTLDAANKKLWITLKGTFQGVTSVQLQGPQPVSRPPLTVYNDGRGAGWEDWSWGDVTRSFTTATPVHAGSASIATTYTGGWSGLKLARTQPLSLAGYDVLRFWVHGGASGNQTITVHVVNAAGQVEHPIHPAAGTWTRVDVPLAGLATREVTAIEWFNNTDGAQPTFYLDDISFLDVGPSGPALTVDAGAGRRAISPYIYGMHYAPKAFATEIRMPIRRWGGNDTSRYNWQNNLTNNGSDWYFENNQRQGLSAAAFIARDRETRTKTIITLPMSGWVAKNDANTCGFSTAIYAYNPLPVPNSNAAATDPARPTCGTGIVSYDDGRPVYYNGNQPTDTSISVGPAFTRDWVKHLAATYGSATQGGIRFYNLDNEPDLWHESHVDVHPAPLTYDELRDRTYQYASAIKTADPGAQILGPVSFGWSGYFYSAKDMVAGEENGYTSFPDREAHGNIPLVAWYLQQMRAYQQANGVRLLDYLDLHFYPQNGVGLRGAGDASLQALRLRSTRALWDPTYRDESYIGGDDQPADMRNVRLIPRMRDWVKNNYPGTKLAITEYNWGALDHINGALAQADILGIFGREGVGIATLFDTPHGDRGGKLTPSSPGAYAFRMYRNYDAAGGSFGDTSVRAASTNQEQLAIYAALRKRDGALTLMIINKTNAAITSQVGLANFTPAGSAHVYRYSRANLNAIVREASLNIAATGFSATFPASSITLVVAPPRD